MMAIFKKIGNGLLTGLSAVLSVVVSVATGAGGRQG
jgi:hypothetical protein